MSCIIQSLMMDKGNYYKGYQNCCECYVSKKNQGTNIDHPRDHPNRSIGFHSTIFSDCIVTDKGAHHRCCYQGRHKYARKSFLKGYCHKRFHKNIFAIT